MICPQKHDKRCWRTRRRSKGTVSTKLTVPARNMTTQTSPKVTHHQTAKMVANMTWTALRMSGAYQVSSR